jgi:hypothetical protein
MNYLDEIIDFLSELEDGNLDDFNIMVRAKALLKLINSEETKDE